MRIDIQILCFVVYLFQICGSANILYLAGIPSPSHGIWNFRLIEALAARGHNLTVLSVDKARKPIPNTQIMDMEEIYEVVHDNSEFNIGDFVAPGVFEEVQIVFDLVYKSCKLIGESKGFKKLLNYPNNHKFDLIINDSTIFGCLVAFLHKFNYPPLVNVSPYKYTATMAESTGGHIYGAYIPGPVHPFGVNMSFMQRLENTVVGLYEILYRRFKFQSKFDELVVSMTGMRDLPSTFDLIQKASVTLLNIHPATDFPLPLPPNVIGVGGLQISDPKPLPADLEKFIQGSKKGAVLIAFGTNVRSDIFEDDKQQMVIDVVKKFPEFNFLWKFEEDPTEGKVPNLLVRTWLPQNDILAHPKTKAFISHGGGLSTHEATWHGVPLVAIPFLMDQKTNSYGSVIAGVAVSVDVQTMTSKDLEAAVRAILEDPSYTERMKLRSLRFKTRPMKPVDEAVWWIEYVLKDPNATHLRSPVIELGLFRGNSVDLFLCCFFVLVLVLVILRCVLSILRRFLSPKKSGLKVKKS